MSNSANQLGGQMSLHAIFRQGANVRGGGGGGGVGTCPTLFKDMPKRDTNNCKSVVEQEKRKI